MKRSIIRPLEDTAALGHAAWALGLYCALMNGCVLSVVHSLGLEGFARVVLWFSGAWVLVLFWLRDRHQFLAAAPLVTTLLAFVFGNPFAGCAGWVGGMMERWNAAHEDGLRLLNAVATDGDYLAFALVVTAALGAWCGWAVERRKIFACLLTCALSLTVCVVGQCEDNFVAALLTVAMLGGLVSDSEKNPSRQGVIMCLSVCACLLAAAALVPREFSGYRSWREDMTQSFHDLRYGKQLLPQGNLYHADALKAGDKAVLKVTSQQKKSLYFPAFLGGSYGGGVWKALPGASYGGDNTGLLDWLENQDFIPQTQLAQYETLAGEGLKTNVLRLQVLSGSRDVLYTTAALEEIPKKGKAKQDTLVSAKGLRGQKKYVVRELSGSKPGELRMAADWVAAPRTEEERQYVAAEAVYRNFVYEQYTKVAPEAAAAVEKLFHKEQPKSDSVFGVLNHVRQVLRNMTVDEGAQPPVGQDPITWFLTQSRRGGEMLFASAAVEALRSYGIPARYAEGYYLSASRIGGDGVGYLTGKNARAWLEAYFDGIGWIPLDVVPGYYYDMVSLQQMVSLPEDVSRTSAVLKDDNGLEGMGTQEEGDHKEGNGEAKTNSIYWPRALLKQALVVLLGAALLAECARLALKRHLAAKWRKATPMARAELARRLTYRLLAAWGIYAGLGWKTEEVDALVAETCPKTAPGDYSRAVGLLEQSLYGDIPPEVYEERTLKAFLRKITCPTGKAPLHRRIWARYCWMKIALN